MSSPIKKGEEVRELLFNQPVARLMLPPYNRVDVRDWGTDYRGWVLICTSKKMDKPRWIARNCTPDTWRTVKDLQYAGELLKGYAIGIGRLVDCRKPILSDFNDGKTYRKYLFSKYYCFIYEDLYNIKPIPMRGVRKLLKVRKEFIDSIETI